MIRKRFQGMVTTVENGSEKADMEKEGIRGLLDVGADEGFRVSEATAAEEKVDMGKEERKKGLGFGEGEVEKSFRRRPHRKLRLFQDDEDEDDDVGVVGVGFGVLEKGDRGIGSEGDAELELHWTEVQKKVKGVVDQVGPSSTVEGAGAVSNEVEVIGKGGDDVDAEGVNGGGEFRVLRRKRKKVVVDDVDREVGAGLVKKIKMEDNDSPENRKGYGYVETKVPKDAEIERKLQKAEGSDMKHIADGGHLVSDSAAKGDVNGDITLVKFGQDDSGKKILKRQTDDKLSSPALAMEAKSIDHKMPNGDSIQSPKQVIPLKSNVGGGLIKKNKSKIGAALSDSLIKKNEPEARVGASHVVLRRNKPGAGVGASHGVPRRNKPGAGVGPSSEGDRGPIGTSMLKKSKVCGIITQSGNRLPAENNFMRDNKSDVQGRGTPTLVSLKSDSLAAYQEQRRMLKRSQSLKKDKMVSTERKTTKPSVEEETKTVNNSLPKEENSGESSLPKGAKAKKRIERSEERRKLRERLRATLLDAGWKIDLRPRKDKNYDDNVYISPTGTSFWSLPKAWNALTASLEQESVNDQGLSKMEGETTKQVVKGSEGGDSPLNMGSIVRNEDLSLLKRKRRKGMEDNVKGEDGSVKKKRRRRNTSHESSSDENIDKNDKDGKKVKILKSSKVENDGLSLSGKRKSARDRNIAPVVKFKEKRKKLRDSRSKLSDKNNIYDKNAKRILHGDTERKHLTPKATSNGVKIGSSQGKKNKRRKGSCGLLVRSSAKMDKRTVEQGASPILKRTVLSWLIDVGVVPEKECVQYWNKKGTRIMLEGWIQREGILCECCNKVISVSKFEDHAGATTRHQPFENIYLQSGKSLTQCLFEAWDTLDEVRKCGKSVVEVDEDDQNDDTCGHCGDGGNLICCDKCPSTFHDDCLKLEDVPLGDWYCLNCTCRICGTVGYVGQNCTNQMPHVIFCEQCEHEYHSKCLQDTRMQMTCSSLSNSSFCGKACEKIYMGLQQLLGTSNSLPEGFSWTLLRRFDDQKMASIQGPSRARIAECNAKLAVAHVVMDECFMPIVDQRTNIDMVSNVVFSCWSNFNRLNYKGFYTAVLEKDDELISVASIRIHGACLAEMPLIGTRHHYRRQGMCRRLVNAVEKMLSSLEVEKLILPAVPDLLQTWNVAFGFRPLEESHKEEIRHLNLMVFPGTDMLQKKICNGETLANESTGEGDYHV